MRCCKRTDMPNNANLCFTNCVHQKSKDMMFAPAIPAIATALLGCLTGQWLRRDDIGGKKKSGFMAIAGLVCLGLAWLWNINFPINKNLWSSSFVLHCAGWSLVLLSLFYLVVDVWQFLLAGAMLRHKHTP